MSRYNRNTLRDYLVEAGQYPLLTKEQEIELAEKALAGDIAARNQLINCNLRLVVSIAKNYKNDRLSLQDLIEEGNMGLIAATEKFDPTLGYRFTTFATYWIRQAISKAIGENGRGIRLPAHIIQLMRKYKAAVAKLQQAGEQVTDEKLAEMLGVEVDKITVLRENKHDVVSLETKLGDGEDSDTLADLQACHDDNPEQVAEKAGMANQIQIAISKLKPRTATIIKMRYGLGGPNDPEDWRNEHTLEAVGAVVGLTRERVRQLEKEALKELKAYLPNQW